MECDTFLNNCFRLFIKWFQHIQLTSCFYIYKNKSHFLFILVNADPIYDSLNDMNRPRLIRDLPTYFVIIKKVIRALRGDFVLLV